MEKARGGRREGEGRGGSLSFIVEDDPPRPGGTGPGLRELEADDEPAGDEAPDEQDALEQRGLVAVAVVGEQIGGDEGHRPFERVAVGR